MNGEVLYEVAEAVIGVSHDGRQDPNWNGKPGYMSEDDLLERLSGHGRETKAQNDHAKIAGHQDNRTMFPKLGLAAGRLEGDVGHVGGGLGSCTGLEK
jgi:hypothetical protein